VALGAPLDDPVTGKVDAFAPDARIVHVDIDPAEIGKVRAADVGIQGDCRSVIEELVRALEALGLSRGSGNPARASGPSNAGDRAGTAGTAGAGATRASTRPDLAPWWHQLRHWQEQFPFHYDRDADGLVKPQMVVETLRDLSPEDTVVVAGVGQHQMWASQWWRFDHPYTWINSGGAGTMGFAVPAAVGAKVGRPDRTVWAIDGDGCFQMTAQELVTASAERIPVKVAILNNAYLGMVRQWQEMFYGERYSEVYLSPDLPDYVKWAEAMGCVGIRAETPEEVAPAIDKANAIDDRPVVIDFRTDAFEKVFPMVPAGASNDSIVVHPDHQDRSR
jgi:acetolactate synthase-1/2/3 large subunit